MRQSLLHGEVVICPTETVYGLCVLQRFRYNLDLLKEQPSSKPLAFVYAHVEQILPYIEDQFTREAIKRLLPGPFTILIQLDGTTVGIRIPEHPFWPEFLDGINEPVLLTSANFHGSKAATEFRAATLIFPSLHGFDGGKSIGKPSKIIDLRFIR